MTSFYIFSFKSFRGGRHLPTKKAIIISQAFCNSFFSAWRLQVIRDGALGSRSGTLVSRVVLFMVKRDKVSVHF